MKQEIFKQLTDYILDQLGIEKKDLGHGVIDEYQINQTITLFVDDIKSKVNTRRLMYKPGMVELDFDEEDCGWITLTIPLKLHRQILEKEDAAIMENDCDINQMTVDYILAKDK